MSGLALALARAAEGHADRLAVVDGATRLTWGELADRVARRAGGLVAEGHVLAGRPAPRIAVQGSNSIATVVDLLAVCWTGATVVPVHPSWSGAYLSAGLARAGVTVVLREAREAPSGAVGPPLSPAPDAEVGLFTSGSTGPPKLVRHRSSSLAEVAEHIAAVTGLRPEDRTLGLLPLAFHYGLTQLTSAMAVGASCVLTRSRLPAQVLETLAEQGCSVVAAVPGLWGPLLAVLEAQPRPLPRLRCVTSAGGRVDSRLRDVLPTLLPGVDRIYFYGQTEVLRSAWVPPEEAVALGGALGRPFPGVELAVVDDEGNAVPPGQLGEVVHGGAYLPVAVGERCPEALPALGGRPGWRTGDLGRRDAQGVVWMEGRRDDLLKVGGFRIGPGPIEDVLLEERTVTGAVVVCLEDDQRGAVLVAAVSGTDVDTASLRRQCRAALPAYMVPSRVVRWTGPWPASPNGKRDRRAVAAALAARREER